MKLLDKVNSPKDLKKLELSQLPDLSEEIREYLIDTISQVGGHLASNLGTVELTVALHYALNSPDDRICWDVGHQTYTHKILTGRKDALPTVRQLNGISGFPKISESEHDAYNVGHAGTSISQAMGEAVASNLLKSKRKKENFVVSVTGDASIFNGLSFEAMNHAGYSKIPFLIVLNDNEMSISKNVGALSYTLNNIITTRFYSRWRPIAYKVLRWIPFIGSEAERLASRFSSSMKSIITDHQFFEELGFRYLGPINGHDVVKLTKLFQKLSKNLSRPTILHVVTKKGKGCAQAEQDPTSYHGVSPFTRGAKPSVSASSFTSFSKIAGGIVSKIAEKDKTVCAITPAMTEGSGLTEFAEKHPERFFDTGITEAHAATFSGALAKAGLKPFFFVYSTFLQRSYDQLIHDIALMKLPVRLVVDRAGNVGADGETHHGMYDIAYLSSIPDMKILSASSAEDLVQMLHFMHGYQEAPIAVRFPRASAPTAALESTERKTNFSPWKARILKKGKDAVLFVEGIYTERAREIAASLAEKQIDLEVVQLLSLKPLDSATIKRSATGKHAVFTLENHSIRGGLGSLIQQELMQHQLFVPTLSFGFPDEPVTHGSIVSLEKKYGLDKASLEKKIIAFLNKANKRK